MKPRWTKIGNGRISIWHRPGRTQIPGLKAAGCTHVVTLLSEREDAADIGELVIGSGMDWIWLPLPEGKPPQGKNHTMVATSIPVVSAIVDEGASILIHCSAGIHRTGMFLYALLRFRRFTSQETIDCIESIRRNTVSGLRPEHFAWGEKFAPR